MEGRISIVKGNTINWINYLELAIIVFSAIFPLLFSLPYRVNIFLSWEGAYRLYLGQIPFKDFGLPLGFGFWLIPALFFKVFGPYLITLVKAQAFINLVSLVAFRNILKLLKVEDTTRCLAVLILILSYSFPSFWPWYNHTVFVFQLLSLNFILLVLFSEKHKFKYLYVALAGFFSFLSFFTKQDSGAIAIVFGSILLLYNSLLSKNYRYLLLYSISIILWSCIFIVPFLKWDFLYWFNLGQPPHNSRISAYSFFNHFFSESEWAKFYLFIIMTIVWGKMKNIKSVKNERFYIFFLITIGVVLQAVLVQVTSPLTPDGQNYFHAFVFAFAFAHINLNINLRNPVKFAPFVIFIILWWSPLFWDYTTRILKIYPKKKANVETDYSSIQSKWVATSEFKAFRGILMPEATIQGIRNIVNLDLGEHPKVLNMTELTPLAYELGYEPPKDQPLWYHLNVGMFQKEVDLLNSRIENKEYDLVLFQSIPGLDNFFPYEIQKKLKEEYSLINTFEAPRKRSEGYSFIEVYIKNK